MSIESERNGSPNMSESLKESEGVKKTSTYIPGENSGKWSDEEHMKYVVFIDYNKEKMRSKEKRR